MNEVKFNIRLYFTGGMKRLTDRIDNTGKETPQRYVLNAMTELFDSLSDEDLKLIRLRYVEDLTLGEVARRCYLNESTIRRHTNPTVKKVKEIIKQGNELSIKQKKP
ncbi:sigma-70 family RNA polymerase sigma factor [Lactococcus lactis]|uniref:sigma factor-like helix-turn-helix DNA-binding protein n=1 Tax=Lactococcus lactis TaxID=1358 RepID=UPI00223C2A98|nr:sigma factor-like helix-turn-helix DNA-binding protein [Lactococcus lactis]MCT1183564.1 sigma-70 family RNA polymerase sigma factor [Lactococcus lactis]